MSLPEMMRSAVLTAALLLPCQALCELAHANESSQAWPTKEWRTSTPEEQGMGSAALAKLVDYGATHELESMLIVRHGAIVAEAYYAPFRAGVKHRMNSATKSVIGTLVAIALKEGRLSSTDQRAVDFFADRTIANLDDRKRAITIQNLLDMTSGLNWTEPLGDGRPQSMIAMERSADWTQFVLDQPMTAGPGTTFNYSSGNPHLLSAILTKATGESALDYARERLFGPLGISDVFWRRIRKGFRSAASDSSYSRATWRSSATFGYATGFGMARRSSRRHGSTGFAMRRSPWASQICAMEISSGSIPTAASFTRTAFTASAFSWRQLWMSSQSRPRRGFRLRAAL